jgi:hypothetical protein
LNASAIYYVNIGMFAHPCVRSGMTKEQLSNGDLMTVVTQMIFISIVFTTES